MVGSEAFCRSDECWLTLSRFTGPKITLNLDDLSESQERALAEEGLEVEDVKPVIAGTEHAATAKEAESEEKSTV